MHILGVEGQDVEEDGMSLPCPTSVWLGNSLGVSSDGKAEGLWVDRGAQDQGREKGNYVTLRMW